MTDREINERLAKALGWEVVDHEMFTPDPCELWLDLKTGYPVCAVSDFSPATSVDALRKWVLPEIKARGLMRKFDDVAGRAAQCSHAGPEAFDILSCEPSTLAAAALAVLEEDK